MSQYVCDEDLSDPQNLKTSTDAPSQVPSEKDGCFDCNICLGSLKDPVVTLCGHVYCWPCIYKWLSVPPTAGDLQQCPVCKSRISPASLIPLYGRGSAASGPKMGMGLPQRPKPCGLHNLMTGGISIPQTNQTIHHQQGYFGQYPYGGSYGGGGLGSPTSGMFGEMIYARMFGSADTSLFTYQQLAGGNNSGSSPRIRRHEMQVDKSLSRVSLFIFCCFVLCLIFF